MSKLSTLFNCRKEIILEIKKRIKLIQFQKEYRKANSNNGTVALNIFPLDKVDVGDYSYGGIKYLTFGNDQEHLSIGNFCSIAEDVCFLAGGEHNYKRAFLFPVYSHVFGNVPFEPTPTKGPIVVEDDVWIGYGATILSGVRIGKGSVVGAGSVVSKDIPPFSIYIGNTVFKSRFKDDEVKKYLCSLNYLSIPHIKNIESQRFISEMEITNSNICEFEKIDYE